MGKFNLIELLIAGLFWGCRLVFLSFKMFLNVVFKFFVSWRFGWGSFDFFMMFVCKILFFGEFFRVLFWKELLYVIFKWEFIRIFESLFSVLWFGLDEVFRCFSGSGEYSLFFMEFFRLVFFLDTFRYWIKFVLLNFSVLSRYLVFLEMFFFAEITMWLGIRWNWLWFVGFVMLGLVRFLFWVLVVRCRELVVLLLCWLFLLNCVLWVVLLSLKE